MKDLKRLNASADFKNHPHGYLVLDVRDGSGGDFDLHPKIDDTMIYLPSTEAPGYRVAIAGENPEVLERLGRAILTLARNQKDGAGSDTPADE